MAVWLVRAGKHGEKEAYAIESGVAVIGWDEIPDLTKAQSRDEVCALFSQKHPEASPKSVITQAAQLWAFAHRIEKDDLVVIPLKSRPAVAIGVVLGAYTFTHEMHTRKVEWRKFLPRKNIGQDLLYSMGAFMTVCQIERNGAEQRLRKMLDDPEGIDPHLKGHIQKNPSATALEPAATEAEIDLEEMAMDQIRRLIDAKFKGHGLARLIEALLKTMGFQTYCSPPGPDGGVDIRAGRGAFGLETDQLFVQVKSGGIQRDSDLREFEGVMRRAGVSKGLFVSWDGFERNVEKAKSAQFFHVRLWESKDVIDAVLENYTKLPEEIQTELPLKRIWINVPQE